MSDSRYTIVVTEHTFEKQIRGKDWAEGAGTGGERNHGYTPEIEKTVSVERELFKQNIAEIDLVEIIKAVNDL